MSDTPQRELPRYKCYKEVWALKIAAIGSAPANAERVNAGGDWLLFPAEQGYGPVLVGHDDYVTKHKPQIGGYYVVYSDGYKSYSPAKAFEDGYALAPVSATFTLDQIAAALGTAKVPDEVQELVALALARGS